MDLDEYFALARLTDGSVLQDELVETVLVALPLLNLGHDVKRRRWLRAADKRISNHRIRAEVGEEEGEGGRRKESQLLLGEDSLPNMMRPPTLEAFFVSLRTVLSHQLWHLLRLQRLSW